MICARIASQAEPLEGRHVVEIGPGPGGLTRALLDTGAASVTAVELDPRAANAARELADGEAGRLRVIEADALKLDMAGLVAAPRVVVANLPYNVGTPLLVGWLRQAGMWERLALMFQAEVAQRIAAAPDTDGYGRLSVLAQSVCHAEIRLSLPPGVFVPPPKVSSAVVVLTPLARQPTKEKLTALERVTAAAFGQRRKMLRGSLRGLGGETLLERAGIAAERRAETLSIADFERLADALGHDAHEPAALPP